MADDYNDDDLMTDADLYAALDEMQNGETEEISELLKLMNEHQIISWEEAERILGDTSDTPIKSSLPPQTRPTEPENDTNINETIKKLLENDPKLTQINLNNMKRTPIPQIKRIIEAIKDNKYIEKLCLANLGLYDHDITNLIDVLQVNESLKHINVETNYLGGEFFANLFKAALENETLEEVKCVNQGVSFPTDKEKEIIKAIQQNHGLLKVSINLRLPEGRHKIENALIRNQDIRREIRRRQRLAEQEANKQEIKKEEKPKGIPPGIGTVNTDVPKKKIIQVPESKLPEKIKPPPKKILKELPVKNNEPTSPEPLKVYRRKSTVSQSDQNESSTSQLNSPISKTNDTPLEIPPMIVDKNSVEKIKSTVSPTPKKKEIPPVEKKNPKPMGVYPRSRVPSYKKTDDESSRVNSAMSMRTDESESERELIKEAVNGVAKSDDVDKQITTDNEDGQPKKKKKIIKKKVIKKVIKKKKKGDNASSDVDGNEKSDGIVNSSQAEESDKNNINNYTDTESEVDSRPTSKLNNHDTDEIDKKDDNINQQRSNRIPPPVLPKTTRVSNYSGYTPSASGYNNSRYGGYTSRYSRY